MRGKEAKRVACSASGTRSWYGSIRRRGEKKDMTFVLLIGSIYY